MSIIAVSNLTHAFGGQTLFENISFSVEHNSRIGLVGRNGTGKTTLFDILTGRITPASGEVHRATGRTIAFLEQEPVFEEDLTLDEIILTAREGLLDISNALEETRELVLTDPSPENLDRLAALEEEFQNHDGYHFELEVRNILMALGLDKCERNQKVGSFSGGERTRIQLARILLNHFDLLLLDEPTNHLDFAMIFWMENYLNSLKKPYIIISHDRHFLDKTVTKILEIRQKSIFWYGGNFSQYQMEAQTQMEFLEKQYSQQQKLIQKTEDFIRKNMEGQKVKQAKSRLKMLERMDRIELPSAEKTANFRIRSDHRSGNDVFRLDRGSFGFDQVVLAENLELEVFYQDRIAIIGKNGCGKTTLLKLLMGEHSLKSGKMYTGASLKVGYYDQTHILLNPDRTVMDTIWELMPGAPKGQPIGWLARFGFTGDDLEKMVGNLSGGERSRLYLGKLIHQRPNLLILDEPTNHLDLATIENLETALNEYDGTIIFVSHDLYFVKNVATRHWHFHDRTIEDTELSPEEIFDAELARKKNKKADKEPARAREKRVNPMLLERLMGTIKTKSDEIGRLNAELRSLEDRFVMPETYADPAKLKKLQEAIAAQKTRIEIEQATLDKMELEYLELTEDEA